MHWWSSKNNDCLAIDCCCYTPAFAECFWVKKKSSVIVIQQHRKRLFSRNTLSNEGSVRRICTAIGSYARRMPAFPTRNIWWNFGGKCCIKYRLVQIFHHKIFLILSTEKNIAGPLFFSDNKIMDNVWKWFWFQPKDFFE